MQWGTWVPWLPQGSLCFGTQLVHPMEPQCKSATHQVQEEEQEKAEPSLLMPRGCAGLAAAATSQARGCPIPPHCYHLLQLSPSPPLPSHVN